MDIDVLVISVVLEILFLLIVLMFVWRRVASDKRMGVSACKKVGNTIFNIVEEYVPGPVFHAMQVEGRMFKSVVLFITRKVDLPLGTEGIPYGNDWRMTGYFLVVIAFVEVFAADAVCVYFAWGQSAVRVLVLAISVYGIIWCLGFVAGSKTMPCYVSEEKIVLRCGIMYRVEIPWESVLSVCLKKVELEKRRSLIRSGRHLCLNNGFQTNELALWLRENSKVTIDGKLEEGAISEISFSADSPSATIRTMEKYLEKYRVPKRD